MMVCVKSAKASARIETCASAPCPLPPSTPCACVLTQVWDEWFRAAVDGKVCEEPNAICLASADDSGAPSARVVLLKVRACQGCTSVMRVIGFFPPVLAY
jgi:hypothetical protein